MPYPARVDVEKYNQNNKPDSEIKKASNLRFEAFLISVHRTGIELSYFESATLNRITEFHLNVHKRNHLK
jgi:hypothetical protein